MIVMSKVYTSIDQLISGTRCSARISRANGLGATILAKRYFNPAGSVKDKS